MRDGLTQDADQEGVRLEPPVLSVAEIAQLRRLAKAAQQGTDPNRTGVGRRALAEFMVAGLIADAGHNKIAMTARGLRALAAAPGLRNG